MWCWNQDRVPISATAPPVAIENTANAMPASRMLPPTFSAKAAYIGTSIASAKVTMKLILSSRRARGDRDENMGRAHGITAARTRRRMMTPEVCRR